MHDELAEGLEGVLEADQIPIGVRRWKDPKGWEQIGDVEDTDDSFSETLKSGIRKASLRPPLWERCDKMRFREAQAGLRPIPMASGLAGSILRFGKVAWHQSANGCIKIDTDPRLPVGLLF